MCLQAHRRQPFPHFFFHPPIQLVDLRFQSIQGEQQMSPPLRRIGQQRQLLQLRPPHLRPQLPLLLHTLARRHRLQLVLHLRPRHHLLVPMHQQLPHVPLFQTRHPDSRKLLRVGVEQQMEQMLRVPPVGLLPAHHLGSDPGRIAQPQLVPELGQQPLKPRIVPASLHPHPRRAANDRTAPLLRGARGVVPDTLPFHCQRSRPAENSDENHSL